MALERTSWRFVARPAQGADLVLIDTDDVAQGDPVIDMAGMALVYERVGKDDTALSVAGVTVAEMQAFFSALLERCYGTDDEAFLRQRAMERTLSQPKMLYGLVKTSALSEEAKADALAMAKAGLVRLLDALSI